MDVRGNIFLFSVTHLFAMYVHEIGVIHDHLPKVGHLNTNFGPGWEFEGSNVYCQREKGC